MPVDLTPPGSGAAYRAAVTGVIDGIRSGRPRKAIVSRRIEVPFAVDLPSNYVRGLALNTPARSFLLDLGGRRSIGFSPETVVEASPAGQVLTNPLAGSRPRHPVAELDPRLRDELRWNTKECYEHVISVRLADEELRSVCQPQQKSAPRHAWSRASRRKRDVVATQQTDGSSGVRARDPAVDSPTGHIHIGRIGCGFVLNGLR